MTKYYYAGSQRIVLRVSGHLSFLLGDHLGSASMTTDANGLIASEMRYKAWGEVRYSSGLTPTQYQFTGQYSYANDFGLLFFNARWIDPSLGRFAQADTIIPPSQSIQAWDRYAYANNSPVKYTDPSGHAICGGITYAQQYAPHCDDFDKEFNLSFTVSGNNIWSAQDKFAARQAVWYVSNAFGRELKSSAQSAWNQTYGKMTFQMGGCDECRGKDHAGFSAGKNLIKFAGLSDVTGQLGALKRRNLVVHELGHSFYKIVFDRGTNVYTELGKWRNSHPGYPDRENFSGESGDTGPMKGFASLQNVITWQQSLEGTDGEEFADQFLGWTYNTWQTNSDGTLHEYGQARATMMNTNMPLWVNIAAGK